ncbi:MAG: carbohydrate porin [Pirellula sp.]
MLGNTAIRIFPLRCQWTLGCLATAILGLSCVSSRAQDVITDDEIPWVSDAAEGEATGDHGLSDLIGEGDAEPLQASSSETASQGMRPSKEPPAFRFQGRSTHFGFGVDGGIRGPLSPPLGNILGPGDVFLYTGRGEYDFMFNLEKFGGPSKGSLLIRAEHWYGDYGNVSLRTGSLTPAVFPALLPTSPDDPGVPYMTNFLLTQPLSESVVVYAGKKDVLGGADQNMFAGGDGTSQFVNQAFIANPAFLLAMPYTSFTAGTMVRQEWGGVGLYVYDPKNRTQDFFEFGDLFADGVIVGTELKLRTEFFQRKGEQHVGGIWKHTDLVDLRFQTYVPGDFSGGLSSLKTKPDSYTLYYGFDQYLVERADKPGHGWGLFGRASISDGNPTPLNYFLSLGVGGFSPLRPDHRDRFGLGWYYVGASDEFGPIPQALLAPNDGTGIEAFYNFQITKCVHISPDVQWIKPGAQAIADNAFVYGLRLNASF